MIHSDNDGDAAVQASTAATAAATELDKKRLGLKVSKRNTGLGLWVRYQIENRMRRGHRETVRVIVSVIVRGHIYVYIYGY